MAASGTWNLSCIAESANESWDSRSTADRRVGEDIASSGLQRTIFYTPSEWADIGRLWRFTTRRESRSESTGKDHLPSKPVIHPEHAPEAIRIPPAPNARASTLPGRAPAQVAVRPLIVRLMSYCTRKPIS